MCKYEVWSLLILIWVLIKIEKSYNRKNSFFDKKYVRCFYVVKYDGELWGLVWFLYFGNGDDYVYSILE